MTLMFEHEEGPVVKEVFLNFGLHGVSEEQIYDIAKEIGDAIGKLLALFLVVKPYQACWYQSTGPY